MTKPIKKTAEEKRAEKKADAKKCKEDEYTFVVILPDGTEADMDDPEVCVWLDLTMECLSRGLPIPDDLKAYPGQSKPSQSQPSDIPVSKPI